MLNKNEAPKNDNLKNNRVLYQLSESQKSIWYLEKAYPGTSLNVIAGSLRLKGDIDYEAFGKAINICIKKNDAVRIRITEENGVALQYVAEYSERRFEFFDFSKKRGLEDLFAWDEEQTRKPFDIIDNDLFYFALFKVSDTEGGGYVRMHHLISDAWSMGLFVKQTVCIYTLIKKGLPVDETPNPSFLEHLMNNEAYEKTQRFEKDRDYWNAKFKTLPEMTVLKPQKANGGSVKAKRKTLITPLKLSNKIREFCSANQVSVFTLFMSALSIYINRVTGIEDIVLGTTILNRTSTRDKETVGMFVSVAAPVRISVRDTMDFVTFSKAMLKENTDILRHQKYPYNYLLRDLKKTHKLTNRLFDIVLNYQNTKFQKNESEEDYTARWHFSGSQVESLVISINDREDGGNLIIDYDFLTDVFNIKEIEFIHQHIISLLWHALDNPTKRISKLDMISEKEKHTLLHEFNNTYADYPRDKTIQQVFEEQAEKTPERTALIFGDQKMTYRELNERANRLARRLRELGVGRDTIVAIMTPRSVEMMVGIMAILKAGGAYMPIDPDYPAERIDYMLKNSRAGLLLARHGCVKPAEFGGHIIDLDEDGSYSAEISNPVKASGPKDLAYVIYTSGSTGRPKGVMIEHTGVINRISWMLKKYPFDENSVILQKTTYTFDVSVWELFSWFFTGASLCLLGPGDEKDPEAIISAVENNGVTAVHFVPSMLSAFLHYVDTRGCWFRLRSLVNVFASGEALTIQQAHAFNRLLYETNGATLSNLYGPTEATVEVSSFECSPMPALNSVPIGKPIDNISLYILDKNQNLLPVGIPGELCIGGVGVARGYLHNPELTAERFVINPYKRNEILYKTGDRVRWYPKGDIEFLGRMDHQVKVRGFRIELGEIEERLMSHGAVLEAVVKPFTDGNGSTFLAAYIVADGGIDETGIRDFLSETLPDYMVPSSFVFLDKMPLNSSGKADRSALEKPDFVISGTEYRPPSNETEAALVEIWQKVLGHARIGVLDEYAALGGDSLNAIRIVTEIHQAFGITLSPRSVFMAQTVRKLAAQIAVPEEQAAGERHIPNVPDSAYCEVSAAQKRQYLLNMLGGGVSYNLPGGLVIDGPFDKDDIARVFKTLSARHESLRTSFELKDGRPVQIVHDRADPEIDYITAETTETTGLMASFVRPFDLSRAPLFRVQLVRVSENRHILLFDMHHIISDGTSVNIILGEIGRLLSGASLPELTVRYRDFSAWHNGRIRSEEMKVHEAYWLEKYAGEISVLDLPLDFTRPAVQSYRGGRITFDIDEKLTDGIRNLAARTGATLFMLLFSAYNVLLSRYSGREDIVVGTPVEGRLHGDLQGIVGMFVNTLALRTKPGGGKSFDAYLGEVKEELLGALEHQEYPFEELVEKAGIQRDMSRNPLFDVSFSLQNMKLNRFSAGGLSLEPYAFYNGTSKFDLTLEACDKGGTISCTFEYGTALFREETIRGMAEHFLNLLRDIVISPDKQLHELRMLSDQERHRLLVDFNDTAAEYPRDKTIHQIFEEQAALTPDKTALVFRDETMTYRELNERTNSLARTLREKGVGPDVIVGIMADRSLEMMIGILAILKAGGAYMPIDPDYPEERIRYMLENSGVKILLLKTDLKKTFDKIIINLEDESAYHPGSTNLTPVNKPSDLAYIIYTSGSTGRPKGVMIEHRNVVGLFFNNRFPFIFNQEDVWTLFHSYCFDFTVWEMYGALLHGGKLIIVPWEASKDLYKYRDILIKEKVTVLNQTPQSMYSLIDLEMQDEYPQLCLRYIFLGAEALKPSLLKPLKARYPDVQLVNLYGPTETTIFVTLKMLNTDSDLENDISNIGSPIAMMKAYVTDRYLQLVPTGVQGELYVSGNGVGRGYINNPGLTAERFIDNPFEKGSTLYKTGDLVRMLPNGDLEYVGRIDGQVKIHGYRIELGDIECALYKHPAIEKAIVEVIPSNQNNKKICVYYMSSDEVTSAELTDFLKGILPAYMIPSYFVRVECFPLNRSGKLDRSLLPKPYETENSDPASVMPRNAIEKLIASVWSEVLERPSVGIDDNFFDVGGDSLSAVRLISKLKLGLSAIDLYTHPTIRALSARLQEKNKRSELLVNLSNKHDPTDSSLICFPYGGGSALSYRDISNAMDRANAKFSVYAVNLPGHDVNSPNEMVGLGTLARDLAAEIKENIQGEIIFYAHCIGCALAMATARLLQSSGVVIKKMYIGGMLVPKRIRLFRKFFTSNLFLSRGYVEKLLKQVGMPDDVRMDGEFTAALFKSLQHDKQSFADYFYTLSTTNAEPLPIPLCVVVGDYDSSTKHYQKKYLNWKKYFKDVSLYVIKDADHYFVNTHADILVDYLLQ